MDFRSIHRSYAHRSDESRQIGSIVVKIHSGYHTELLHWLPTDRHCKRCSPNNRSIYRHRIGRANTSVNSFGRRIVLQGRTRIWRFHCTKTCYLRFYTTHQGSTIELDIFISPSIHPSFYPTFIQRYSHPSFVNMLAQPICMHNVNIWAIFASIVNRIEWRINKFLFLSKSMVFMEWEAKKKNEK